MIHSAARTHLGLKRSKNEDKFVVEPELGLWVVADGIGGHSSGEVASAIACETIVQCVKAGDDLAVAIATAHRAVLSEIQNRDARASSNEPCGTGRGIGADHHDERREEHREERKMGTTVVALRVSNDAYEIAWVGDSRAYLYDGALQQLTTDHSTVNDLLVSGVITAQEAATHPQRHTLSRSLGVSARIPSAASVLRGRLNQGQQILLCSDGLTDELSDSAIAKELQHSIDLETQAEALKNAALAQGGRDNITVVLIGKRRPRIPERHV